MTHLPIPEPYPDHRWRPVVFACECDPDTGDCPRCGVDYADCPCPGPTQDNYQYAYINGVLHAKPTFIPDLETE